MPAIVDSRAAAERGSRSLRRFRRIVACVPNNLVEV